MAKRAAIVTGASSGIGLEIARLLGSEGHAVTLAARRPEKLEGAAKKLAGEGGRGAGGRRQPRRRGGRAARRRRASRALRPPRRARQQRWRRDRRGGRRADD